MTRKIMLAICFFPQNFPKGAGFDTRCYMEVDTYDKTYFSLSFGELKYFAIFCYKTFN